MENKRKHLEFVQNAINRMASNLFFLKGWTITLIAALFALFTKSTNPNYIFIVYFPVVIFWILDGYFLSRERLFRDLYDDISKLGEKEINFSMDTNEYKKNKKNSWICSLFSSTLIFFYLPLLVIILLVTYLIN